MTRAFNILLILVSGLCIGLSFIVTPTKVREMSGEKSLAELFVNQGQVKVIRHEGFDIESIKQKTILYNSDSVETSDFSNAILIFSDRSQIKLDDNTTVTLEKTNGAIYLYIKKGDLKVVYPPKSLKIFINQQGTDTRAEDYQGFSFQIPTLSANSKATSGNEIKQTVTIETAPPPPEKKEPKSQETNVSKKDLQDMIIQALQKEKNTYYKCYTQFLQRNPAQMIESNISLTITKDGKSTAAKILSINTPDQEIRTCFINVTTRIEIKGFKSDEEITTSFPIKFE